MHLYTKGIYKDHKSSKKEKRGVRPDYVEPRPFTKFNKNKLPSYEPLALDREVSGKMLVVANSDCSTPQNLYYFLLPRLSKISKKEPFSKLSCTFCSYINAPLYELIEMVNYNLL